MTRGATCETCGRPMPNADPKIGAVFCSEGCYLWETCDLPIPRPVYRPPMDKLYGLDELDVACEAEHEAALDRIEAKNRNTKG